MWGVRVFVCIAMFMMFQMQLRVCLGVQKGRSLGNKGEEVKELLPTWAHPEHFVSGIPVEKKALRKGAQIPMQEKETYYDEHDSLY
jgi:hypothetical protein